MADLTSPTIYNVGPVFLDSGHTRVRSQLAGLGGIVAGQPYYLDPTTGTALPTTSLTAGKYQFRGIAIETAGQGQGFDGVEEGFVNGYDLSNLAFDALVYLSDNAGNLATAAGTNSVVVGRVVAVSDRDPATGKPSKLLYIRPNMTGNW